MMRKSGVLIQSAMSDDLFSDMMRLTYQRHAAYARAHDFDYWHILGDYPNAPSKFGGSWHKIFLIRDALKAGYQHVIWIDADAAIVNGVHDLKDAPMGDAVIGAVKHDAPWFHEPHWMIPVHFNVGVLFFKAGALEFVEEWLVTKPTDADERWAEQGVFNAMVTGKWADKFVELPAEYNATVNVNMVAHPFIKGWHGINPIETRLNMMRGDMVEDHLRFRV